LLPAYAGNVRPFDADWIWKGGAMRLRSPIQSSDDDVAIELVRAKEFARAERIVITKRVLNTLVLIAFAIGGGATAIAQLLKLF
jgi:hypothetical protein